MSHIPWQLDFPLFFWSFRRTGVAEVPPPWTKLSVRGESPASAETKAAPAGQGACEGAYREYVAEELRRRSNDWMLQEQLPLHMPDADCEFNLLHCDFRIGSIKRYSCSDAVVSERAVDCRSILGEGGNWSLL